MVASPASVLEVREFLQGDEPQGASAWVAETSPRFIAISADYRVSAPLRLEMHRGFELGVVIRGHDERHCAHRSRTCGAGDVWLHSMWEPHGGRIRLAGTEELVVIFLPQFLGDETVASSSWLSMFAAPPTERLQPVDRETRKLILGIAQEMRKEISAKHPGFATALRLGVLRILLALYRSWEPRGYRASGAAVSDLARVVPAVELVRAQHDRRIGLAEAAAACGFSIPHFGRLFHRAMGVSFAQFAMRTRLAAAARMLLDSDRSESAIALSLGFADASHFHHSFVKHFRTTPRRYREMTSSDRRR